MRCFKARMTKGTTGNGFLLTLKCRKQPIFLISLQNITWTCSVWAAFLALCRRKRKELHKAAIKTSLGKIRVNDVMLELLTSIWDFDSPDSFISLH